MEKKYTIIAAISGGVDSSVAALLLKKAGHNVIGLFMRNWHDESLTINNECPWIEDSHDALQICQQLNIPFQIIDLSKEYKERIVDYMTREYSIGNTPNPDILCNREIKFDVFLKHAMQLNADFIATGHYCIKSEYDNIVQLKQGRDRIKDQSYFLCQINQEQLKKTLFPIGELTKKEVRKIAKDNNLVTANKKDSQGLCFVGKIKLPVFLQNQLKNKKGDIIEISNKSKIYQLKLKKGSERKYSVSDGKKIGEHIGAHYFTVGQRKGLNIGGKKSPLFVISTNITTNTIFVGMGKEHPGLFRKNLKIYSNYINWLRKDKELKNNEEKEYFVRIRHRQILQKAILKMTKDYLHIEFVKNQRGIAKGQFAAWYENEELIGSGPIY